MNLKGETQMRIFCYGCKTEEETQWLVRCAHCETKDIGIEEDKGWHSVCRLFAISKTWMGNSDELSLPWYFEKKPDLLEEWKSFKARLQNVELPLLPEVYMERQDIFDFWVKSSGVFSLQMGSTFELLHTPFIGDLVRRLAGIYADFHFNLRHGGQVEKEKPTAKKGKKKSLFPKGTKGREFKRPGR
jgi:hypothetical protein